MEPVLSEKEWGAGDQSKREGGSSSEWLTLTNDSLSKLRTRASGLCLFALGGRRVGLHFLYLTVNGWPGPPMFFSC